MTEKRFELRSYGNDDLWEMKDRQGESLLTWGDIEKKLNQLAEENEQLRKQIHNIDYAIEKAVSDLRRTEEVYLADFDIVKRISEYEKELFDDE